MKTALGCLAIATTLFSNRVKAECITPPPPCEALARAAIVVVVDVIEAASPWTAMPIPQAVKLRVVERFKGVSQQEREIAANIFNNVEAVFLEPGKRYLVYTLQNKDGTWVTSCSRTKLADVANAELRELRQCGRK